MTSQEIREQQKQDMGINNTIQTYGEAMAEQYQPRICLDEDGNEYLDF